MTVELKREHQPYYAALATGPHVNWVVEADQKSLNRSIVTIETRDEGEVKGIWHNRSKSQRFYLPHLRAADKRDVTNALKGVFETEGFRLHLGGPELGERLEYLEHHTQVLKKFKFGVLLCKDDQSDENKMFSNPSTPAFEEFLDMLGDTVELANHTGYRGGLDIKTGTTGTHAVFSTLEDVEVMFHVSTLLPFQEADLQRVERKRHLGNDIVLVVFQDGNALPFDPAWINSHFNHVFVVVRKVPVPADAAGTYYQVAIAHKDDQIPPYRPFLPPEPLFPKGLAFKRFLLTKLISAERMAMGYATQFRDKNMRTRQELLNDAASSYFEEKEK